jgi:hypothetical protein
MQNRLAAETVIVILPVAIGFGRPCYSVLFDIEDMVRKPVPPVETNRCSGGHNSREWMLNEVIGYTSSDTHTGQHVRTTGQSIGNTYRSTQARRLLMGEVLVVWKSR